ncbi:UNVERIFIED_CONTAM: hypothetical protein FKN15_007229 [Acipenser sinensis]
MYAEKMAKLGFLAKTEEVFGTAYCSAVYLKHIAKLDGKVYLIGGNALSKELQNVGIQTVGVGPDPVFGGQSDWADVPLDPEVKAVVVGFDEHFSYMKLTKALKYLNNANCLFVGTNTDTRLPLEGGRAVPGSHLEYWHQCTIDIWVFTTVQISYLLQIKHGPPPFQGVTAASVPQDTIVVSLEVAALLQKWAIHIVDPLQLEHGFNSMPKRDGGLRPILDLRQVNNVLCRRRFKCDDAAASCSHSGQAIGSPRIAIAPPGGSGQYIFFFVKKKKKKNGQKKQAAAAATAASKAAATPAGGPSQSFPLVFLVWEVGPPLEILPRGATSGLVWALRGLWPQLGRMFLRPGPGGGR